MSMERITKEELLEMLFHDDYEHLKGEEASYDPCARSGQGGLPRTCAQSFFDLYL